MSNHKIKKEKNKNFIEAPPSNFAKENENISVEKPPKTSFNRPVSQEDVEKYSSIDPNIFHDETEEFIRQSKNRTVLNAQRIEKLKNDQAHFLASINPQYHPQVFDNRPSAAKYQNPVAPNHGSNPRGFPQGSDLQNYPQGCPQDYSQQGDYFDAQQNRALQASYPQPSRTQSEYPSNSTGQSGYPPPGYCPPQDNYYQGGSQSYGSPMGAHSQPNGHGCPPSNYPYSHNQSPPPYQPHGRTVTDINDPYGMKNPHNKKK